MKTSINTGTEAKSETQNLFKKCIKINQVNSTKEKFLKLKYSQQHIPKTYLNFT